MGYSGLEGTGGFDWQDAEDLTALSEHELRAMLGEHMEEERAISYRGRILQGRIDLIRAELVRRGAYEVGLEELARVLMGDKEARP
jgi:hypothetical protein